MLCMLFKPWLDSLQHPSKNFSREDRIFGYLKNHAKHGIMVDTREHTPPEMPAPMGKTVHVTTYMWPCKWLGNKKIHTGILFFVNNTPIKWYSKRQNIVETSMYGAELVALRIGIELIIEFSYKLRLMGLPIEGASQGLYDNKSVVLRTSIPSRLLKKNTMLLHITEKAK